MTFHNQSPAIPGFYSDPTMCAGPDAVHLATSSFEYFPGAPLWRPADMAGFSQIGNVIDRPSQVDLRTFSAASSGIFGSTLRFHDGRFWFITTNIAQVGEGQLIFTAADPAGPWSDPVLVQGVTGIDPDLAWDDDGTCYLTWCDNGIAQVTVDPETGAVLSERRDLWAGTGMKFPEGPHLYHVGEWWYLLIAEGGTESGHSASVARSRRPDSGFEGFPGNPILTHRSTGHPVQSVGHADLVEWQGQWWACYHGTRPHGRSPEFHVIGRETMVCPVEWVDGWPVIREDLALTYAPETALTTDFTSSLDPRWVCPQGDLSEAAPGPGGLVLSAGRPVVIRVQDLEWSAEANIDVSGGTARLLVYLDDEHWYGLEADADGVHALGRCGPFAQEFGRVPAQEKDGDGHDSDRPGENVNGAGESGDPGSGGSEVVGLRISAALPEAGTFGPLSGGPDLITLTAVMPSGPVDLATLDGRYLSTEVAEGFTGRTVGVQCTSGRAVVRHFTYTPEPRA